MSENIIERARAMRAQVEEVAATLPDESATNYTDLFPRWSEAGVLYNAGARVRYEGKLYKCVQPHVSQEAWSPDASPSLWAEVLAGQDGTDVGEWVQPDSTNPYMQGDRVTHNGKLWESNVDNNVWEPGVYGWTEIAE